MPVCFHLWDVHWRTGHFWHLFTLITLTSSFYSNIEHLLKDARFDSTDKTRNCELHQLILIHFIWKSNNQSKQSMHFQNKSDHRSTNPPCQSGSCWRPRGLEAVPRRWRRRLESRCSFCFARSDSLSTAARTRPSSGRRSAEPHYGPAVHFWAYL